jgi:hypothetical protein
MRHLRLLDISFLLTTCVLLTASVAAEDTATQVCTIDADGQETCVASPGQAPSKELCLPDGHCWVSLDKALEERFNNKPDGVHVELSKPVPFGEAQQVAGADNAKTVQVLSETYEYMVSVYNNETTKSFRDGCQCRHEHCAFWAAIGEFEFFIWTQFRSFVQHIFPQCLIPFRF